MNPVLNVHNANSFELQIENGGLKIPRVFTNLNHDPYTDIELEKRSCVIKEPDGTVVFEMHDCLIPKDWSQVSSDVMISKYFRKKGVPQYDQDGNVQKDQNGNIITGPEKTATQVVNRLANCWRKWGEKYNYFASSLDAQSFEDELKFMLINQMAAPNSPQWFNTGLNSEYGISGRSQGHFYCDPQTGALMKSDDAYTHPQPHACFIQSVKDDLVNEGGIMDLWSREARLFKYGSGTGTNFSNIRGSGESLSGGGFSSGLMSFLKIGDRAAGAIKSGGTTRRAAKMVCLDLDHPDIVEFINWKVEEEKKVAALIQGGYDSSYNGEAYATVSGQNSNNSIRISNKFFKALENNGNWDLIKRTDKSVYKSIKAQELWDQIANAAWQCADPGVQYDDTINQWHTCPKDGRINASNPCSEYMFLDNTACNLASINLVKFYRSENKTFDVEKYKHAIRLLTIVLEISVLMAQFPSKEIAELSYKFRTLGLGYANIGSLLMRMGLAYDSKEGRNICSALTAIMTGESYATSSEMASILGVFNGFNNNREDMLRVIHNHRTAAYDETNNLKYLGLDVKPLGLNQTETPAYLLEAAKEAWDKAICFGAQYGYRNAQVSVVAPTGTIGLLMDCDTTGIEPDFALVKFKKLAGGGYWKIINQSVKPALEALNYSSEKVEDIMEYVLGTLSLKQNKTQINFDSLSKLGFLEDELNKLEEKIPGIFHITDLFAPYNLEQKTVERLKISEAELIDPSFNLLKKLGFSQEAIDTDSKTICGQMKIEGAPHLKEEDLAVFDCANVCGDGERFIHFTGHIKMMAAAQSFISGAISKTINMPNEASIDDVKTAYMLSHQLGVKANAIYRDGSKLSQALYSSKSDEEKSEDEETKVEAVATQNDPEFFTHILQRGDQLKLPKRRKGLTIETDINGQKVFLRTGEYDDGKVGEIFIDMFKEGASYRSLLNALAVSVSLGLQYGVPLKKYVDKFTFTRFEPSGITTHENIRTCTSIIDFIFRVLGMEYLNRTDFIHKKRKEKKKIKNSEKVELIQESNSIKPKIINENREDTLSKDLKSGFEEIRVRNPIQSKLSSDQKEKDAVSKHLSSMMGDAPPCNVCGHITIRNGTCYKCLNCGNSLGCS